MIQDLFITFSPLWSSSDQKTTTCKFTIFKISDYQRRVPSIPKKSSFNVQNFTQYFRVFLLRKIFNIFIDDIIGKPLDLTKYVCPRSGRSVKRLYLFWLRDYLRLNSYFRIYDSYNFPNEMWGLLLFRNKRKSVDINRDPAKRNSYPKGPRQGPRTCTNKWTLTGVHT